MGVIGTGAYCFSQAAETPSQDGQMSWEKVVAASKKEGKVVVSVPPGSELRRGFKDRFERRFGIELELVAGRGSAIVRRMPMNTEPVFVISMSTLAEPERLFTAWPR